MADVSTVDLKALSLGYYVRINLANFKGNRAGSATGIGG
jgi:hypothetical protein